MIDHPADPLEGPDDSSGEEPEVESGAGYGNHAPEPDKEKSGTRADEKPS